MKIVVNINHKLIKRFFVIILCFILCFSFSYFFKSSNNIENVSADETINLPIIMYHSILKDKNLQGKFVVSPNDFENDLIYIKENGYSTIVVKDLLDYVYNSIPLPDKPIMLTFDDGYYNNYFYVYPLLQKYDCKIILSPIGKLTDSYSASGEVNPNYSYVTWDNLKEMTESGLVEVQNHSYNMHSQNNRIGIKRKAFESREQYEAVVTEDINKAQTSISNQINQTPTAFVYPFGALGKDSEEILKNMGFKCTMTCEEKPNSISRDPQSLYCLSRFLRPGKISTTEYFRSKQL